MEGFDKLAQELSELEKAISELDGEIANVSFDPQDPQSIDLAIQQINAVVDERLASYSSNEFVATIAEDIKEEFRNQVLENATAARLNGDDDW